MKTKHTEGTWIVNGLIITAKLSSNPNEYHLKVCEVANNSSAHPHEAEANAKLIAAAPDLLEALQAIMNSGQLMAVSRSIKQQCQQAIDKATK